MPADAVARLAAAIAEIAGGPVELERPADPSHGDYATNVALRTAGQHKRQPRERAQEIADAASALPEVDRATGDLADRSRQAADGVSRQRVLPG